MHASVISHANKNQIVRTIQLLLADKLGCSPNSAFEQFGVITVSPEKKIITRKQVLGIHHELSLTASQNIPDRWIVILEAQTMNQEAANALLKLVEEPPPGVHFLLGAPSPASLLPTIRSRVAVVTAEGSSTFDPTANELEAEIALLIGESSLGARFACIAQLYGSKRLQDCFTLLQQALYSEKRYDDLAWWGRYDRYVQGAPNARLIFEAYSIWRVS